MHSFERFGIKHLSASSLNLWRAAPGLFALRYIGNVKDAGSPAMWRGSAVENGLAILLLGRDLEQATMAAHQAFDLNSQDYPEDATEERDLIAPMLEQCNKWQPPSALAATQLKVEIFFDPIPIPVIGWLDFAFDGLDVDLKTTKALPSKPSSDHIRQVSIYRSARGRSGGLLYCTPKKHGYFDIDDDTMNEALAELQADALALNNFLARCESRDDALKSLPVDWSHFRAPKIKVPLKDILLAG